MPGIAPAQKFIYVDTLLPAGYRINSVSVVDRQTAWMTAVYSLGASDLPIKVLRTLDGGVSWQGFEVWEAKSSSSRDIVGRSNSEAWITTGNGKAGAANGLFKTTDGGKSWSCAFDHLAGSGFLRFYDDMRLHAQSKLSFITGRSGDGGMSWKTDTLQRQKEEEILTFGNKMACIVGDTLWAGTLLGRVMRCTNYGENCLFLPATGLSDCAEAFAIAFNDHLNGMLFFFAKDGAGKFAKTTDGGSNWKVLEGTPEILSTCLLDAASGKPPGSFWALSNTGSISTLGYTTDFGNSWDLQTIPGMMVNLQCEPGGIPWVFLLENTRKFSEETLTMNHDLYVSGNYLAGKIDLNMLTFSTSEESHAISLLQGKRTAEAMHVSELPPAVIQQEKKLRDSIDWLEKQRMRLEKNTANPDVSHQLNAIRTQYDGLIRQMESSYPNFLRNRSNIRIVSLDEVQQGLLQPGQAMIQYFITDSTIYIGRIDRNTIRYHHVKKDFPLQQWIAEFRHSLSAFQTDPAQANRYDSLAATYTSLAYRLYEKLLAPVADSLPQHLIIIPDGILGYLPFEVLLTAPATVPTRWQQHDYLLKKHSVSYAYSATMLREMTMHPHRHEPKSIFYGFAPQYDGDTIELSALYAGIDLRKDLAPLPHTGEEVYKAARLLGGKYFVGRDASEATFRALASEARILHLATHGRANDKTGDYSFLVFTRQPDSSENEILYARDIYNLQLNADLVTLSACETGLGELQSNEGIISLARAFTFAGAKSIITSLWPVSDAKTKDLMIDFYKNLRRGMLKDDALRQAKLDFLQRNRGQAAHPFYWAGFVGIGNMGKIE